MQTGDARAADGAADELGWLAAQVDQAVDAAQALDGHGRECALGLKQAVEAFHKAGLTRIVRRLKEDPRGKELLFELADDPLVRALLVMHGIVRQDPAARAARVIDHVRPYVRAQGGDVQLAEVRGAVAYIRLSGSCAGCGAAAASLRAGVEGALRANVPEIAAVEVLPAEPGAGLIMADSIGVRGRP